MAETIPDESVDVEAESIARLAAIEVMKQMPERWRHVLELRHWHGLTEREIAVQLEVSESRVCQLLAQAHTRAEGDSNSEIAAHCTLSVETAKSHVRHILAKTNTRNRSHLVAYAFRQKLIT